MHQLYLLRHGLAVPHGTPEIADEDRPLTAQGERRVRSVGRGLKRLKIKLDGIVSSPLPRAARTAEIVAEVFGKPGLVEIAPELHAEASAAAIEDWLNTRTEDRLMIVGHNPSFSDLLARLVGGPEQLSIGELRKAGVAALRGVEGPSPRYQLDWLARPKLFRI